MQLACVDRADPRKPTHGMTMPELPKRDELEPCELITMTEGDWINGLLVAHIERGKVHLLRDGTYCRTREEVESEGRKLKRNRQRQCRKQLDKRSANG